MVLCTLVVDELASMRRSIRSALKERGGTHVIEAGDGYEALSILRNERIDVILSNLRLPRFGGLQLLKQIRSDKALNHIPFIMMSAEWDREMVFEAIASGVNHFMMKPFSRDELHEKIAAVSLDDKDFRGDEPLR